MVTERYCECLISQKPQAVNIVKAAALAVLTVAAVIIGLTWNTFVRIAAVVFGVLFWFSYQKVRQEYEYLVLDREISVDAIYSRSRRKRIMQCPLQKVVLFAPETSPEFASYKNQGLKLHDFSTCGENDVHFALVCKTDSGTIGFRLTPNKEMLSQMEYELPRGIFYGK